MIPDLIAFGITDKERKHKLQIEMYNVQHIAFMVFCRQRAVVLRAPQRLKFTSKYSSPMVPHCIVF
jgi:hypothetical protein